jgi:hypothetical protein
MTQDDCKLITEKLLGEKWRTIENSWGDDYPCANRTFTTPQDFFACFEKLVERGEWREFEEYYAVDCFPEIDVEVNQYIKWLLSRTESGHFRLCVLCAEWLTAQKEGV